MVKDIVVIAKTPWLGLFERTYRTRSGQEKTWTFVSRAKEIPVNCTNTPADAVVIIAKIDDKLILTAEYRVPIGGYELGFPAGLIDNEETPEHAAQREFFEETGLHLIVESVSPKCFSSAGLSDESVRYVVGKATGEPSNQNLEDSEDILVHLLSVDEIKNIINQENPLGCVGWSAKTLAYLMSSFNG